MYTPSVTFYEQNKDTKTCKCACKKTNKQTKSKQTNKNKKTKKKMKNNTYKEIITKK